MEEEKEEMEMEMKDKWSFGSRVLRMPINKVAEVIFYMVSFHSLFSLFICICLVSICPWMPIFLFLLFLLWKKQDRLRTLHTHEPGEEIDSGMVKIVESECCF